jgi:hypothetical protein
MQTAFDVEEFDVFDHDDEYEESGWELERCFIPVKSSEVSRVYESFFAICKQELRETMLSCEFADYPDYLKMRFDDLYFPAQEEGEESVFDFDAAMARLDDILEYHIEAEEHDNDVYSGIALVGTDFCESYKLFDVLLELAVTSSCFSVKQFIVNSRDRCSSDRWMTIYECHDGQSKVVTYCEYS